MYLHKMTSKNYSALHFSYVNLYSILFILIYHLMMNNAKLLCYRITYATVYFYQLKDKFNKQWLTEYNLTHLQVFIKRIKSNPQFLKSWCIFIDSLSLSCMQYYNRAIRGRDLCRHKSLMVLPEVTENNRDA